MEQEKIVVKAKRRRALSGLAPLFGELGFSRAQYSKDRLIVEKTHEEDLSGKKQLHYRIVFGKNDIEFSYSVPEGRSKRGKTIEVFPVFLNAVRLAEGFYDISASSLFTPVLSLLKDVQSVLDADVADLSSERDTLRDKNAALEKKYEELVRSSEENARILIECERRRNELQKRVGELEYPSDETLKEALFNWLRVHNGNINISEFSKSHNVSFKRIEEGLNLLIKEGYLKKRVGE
jgi:hypothetical protein